MNLVELVDSRGKTVGIDADAITSFEELAEGRTIIRQGGNAWVNIYLSSKEVFEQLKEKGPLKRRRSPGKS